MERINVILGPIMNLPDSVVYGFCNPLWSKAQEKSGRSRRDIKHAKDTEIQNTIMKRPEWGVTTPEPQGLVSYTTCWATTTGPMEKESKCLWVTSLKIKSHNWQTVQFLLKRNDVETFWTSCTLTLRPLHPSEKLKSKHGWWQTWARKRWCFRTPSSSSVMQIQRPNVTAPFWSDSSWELWWGRETAHLYQHP